MTGEPALFLAQNLPMRVIGKDLRSTYAKYAAAPCSPNHHPRSES